MPDHLGGDMRKVKEEEKKEEEIKCKLFILMCLLIFSSQLRANFVQTLLSFPISCWTKKIFYFLSFKALDDGDIALLKTYVSKN